MNSRQNLKMKWAKLWRFKIEVVKLDFQSTLVSILPLSNIVSKRGYYRSKPLSGNYIFS